MGAESAAIWASHGRRVTPLPPSRLQPGWQLPGAEEEREVVLGTLDGQSSALGGTRLCGSGKTVDSVLRGEKDEGRCELSPGVSINWLLAKGA